MGIAWFCPGFVEHIISHCLNMVFVRQNQDKTTLFLRCSHPGCLIITCHSHDFNPRVVFFVKNYPAKPCLDILNFSCAPPLLLLSSPPLLPSSSLPLFPSSFPPPSFNHSFITDYKEATPDSGGYQICWCSCCCRGSQTWRS